MRSRVVATIAILLVLALVVVGCGKKSTSGTAQPSYPEKPIEFICPFSAGGGADTFARGLAKALNDEKIVSQPIVVNNKPGGGGAVALASFVTESKGNPYSLLLYSPSLIRNALTGASPYNYDSMVPLARLVSDYNAILVRSDSPYQTLKDLMDAVKADPSKVSIGGASVPGGVDHVIFCLLAKAAGIDAKSVKFVSFQGGGEAIAALVGGHVNALSCGAAEALGQIQAGTLRALAVVGDKRLGGALASVPTAKEAGYNVDYRQWRGIFAPPEMPEYAQAYWRSALEKLFQTQTWKDMCAKYFWNEDLDTKNFTQYLAEETKMWKDLLTELGLLK